MHSGEFTSEVLCFVDGDGDTVNDCTVPEDPDYDWPCDTCSTTTPIPSDASQMVVYDATDPTLNTY